jgi:hypothetical protein
VDAVLLAVDLWAVSVHASAAGRLRTCRGLGLESQRWPGNVLRCRVVCLVRHVLWDLLGDGGASAGKSCRCHSHGDVDCIVDLVINVSHHLFLLLNKIPSLLCQDLTHRLADIVLRNKGSSCTDFIWKVSL